MQASPPTTKRLQAKPRAASDPAPLNSNPSCKVTRTVTTHDPTPEQQFTTKKTVSSTKNADVNLSKVSSETIVKQGSKVTKSVTYTTTFMGTSRKCGGCKKALGTDEYIIALNKTYHEACFTCPHCETKLNKHRFSVAQGAPSCEPCAKKIMGR